MKTLILAAGNSDYKNKPDGLSSSQLLTIVNGRPIISWVIGDLLKQTDDQIRLIIDLKDIDIKKFCIKWYGKNSRVDVIQLDNSPSILHSISSGLEGFDKPSPVRIVLGDTMVLDKYQTPADTIYVSDYDDDSNVWCVVNIEESGIIKTYHNKMQGLSPKTHKAVVGRYEISDSLLFRNSIYDAIKLHKIEISDALELYAHQRTLTAKLIDHDKWIDFGHLEGIAQARTKLMESREFNSLKLHRTFPIISKSSSNIKKLEQELFWYQNLPQELQSLTPRIMSVLEPQPGIKTINMEFYGYGTLTEKFLYFDLSTSFWNFVLTKLFEINKYFKNVESHDPHFLDLNEIYINKTFQRLEQLRTQNSFWSDLLEAEELTINGEKYKGLSKLKSYIIEKASELSEDFKPQIIHGDYCFNNIVFDISSGATKLIDPRGNFGKSENTIFGDGRYDIAKLRHSFCGYYDFIVENLFEVKREGFALTLSIFDDYHSIEMEHMFDKLCLDYNYKIDEIRFIEALLFISMIPLHKDSLNKQLAFFCQGIVKINKSYLGVFQ